MMIMGAYRLAMEGRFVLCLVVVISSMISIMQVVVLGAAGASVASVVVLDQPPAVARRPIFVLGDSTLDVGNNNYLSGTNVPRANMPYYGVDVPGFPTGRWSNGYNTADFLAKYLAGLVSSPPAYLSLLAPTSSGLPPLLATAALTTGVNYASGGAGILDSTNAGNTIPLSKQVRYFNATRSQMIAAVGSSGAVADLLSKKSVFLIGIGGNDLFAFANAEQALMNRSAAQRQADADAFVASLISNYSAAITDLYSMGACKFAIINVGLAGCLPVARVMDPTGACAGDRNQLAASFNDNLSSLLGNLSSHLPGFTYSLADSLGLMAATFADPPAYGFTDVASACCGSGRLRAQTRCTPDSTLCADHDRLYFWDYIHPSQRAAFLRAQAFYDGPAQYTTPINFKQLVNMS